MARKLLLGWLAIAIAAGAPPALADNGMEDIAVTIRQIGRGGAFIATEPEAGALAGNPAAIAFMDGSELYLDGRVWHSSLEYSGALNGIGKKENYVVPNAAWAGTIGDGVSAGFGVFTIVNAAFRVTDYDVSLLGAPPGSLDRSSTKARFVVFTPGIAVQLDDRTSAGAALHYTSGSADFQAYNMLGDTMGFSLDGMSGEGYALRLGLYHKADESTTLGAYWRSRTHLEITDGTLQSGLYTATPGAVVPGTRIEGFQFPEQFGFGIGRRLGEEWSAYGEYRRLLWGKGSDFVYFVPPAGQPVGVEQAWSDQDVFVLGAEYSPEHSGTIWRFGANHARSAVPDRTLNPLYPAITEWHYTAGWERDFGDGFSLLAGAVYVPQISRSSSPDNSFNPLLGLGQPFTLEREDLQIGIGLSWSFGGAADPECAACCSDGDENSD